MKRFAPALVLALLLSACDKPATPPAPPPNPPKEPAPPSKEPAGGVAAGWEPRAKPIEGDIIVAVVDTGVDGEHPALKGKVLETVNLAPAPGSAKDRVGHGTAVAGLICADSEDDQFDGVCAKLPVKILPIKVTPDLSSETLPTAVGVAVKEAVQRGAHIICIPMGGSFTTDALEEGMALAKEKGVLVVAAAGTGTPATHDFYPAAHPWAISCTGEREAAKETVDGKEVQRYYRADLTNFSGKTELMGPIFAKTISPGGGVASMQGTSVACANAAGLAAMLVAKNRSWSAQRVRDVLTLSGSPDYSGNTYLHCPARHVDKSILESIASDQNPGTDLAVLFMYPEPTPKPDAPFHVRALVRNIGNARGSGTVTCEIKSQDSSGTVEVPDIAEGECREIRIPMKGLKEGKYDYKTTVAQPSGGGIGANDRLAGGLISDPRNGAASPHLNRLEGMRADSGRATLKSRVCNPNRDPLDTKLLVNVSKPRAEVVLHLGPNESREVELPLTLEMPREGKVGVIVTVEVEEEGEIYGGDNLPVDLTRKTYSTQYADVWGLKEVIVDAPASIASSRNTIPFLLFTPEIHTAQIPEKFVYQPAGSDQTFPGSGLWLADIMIDLLDPEQAATYQPSGQFDVDFPIGRAMMTAHQPMGSDRLKGPSTIWTPSATIRVENCFGSALSRNEFLGWKYHDGWHAVMVVPRDEVEYYSGRDYSTTRSEYFRVGVHYFALDKHPDCPTPTKKKSGVDDRSQVQAKELWQESVLRVKFNVDLPRLDSEGLYYDVHVHTASEFSRDAVEPRLAFGGPPWMIARCAHAMGMIDNAQLLMTLLRVHPAGLDFASAHGLDVNKDVLVSTDHNCFLWDKDAPTAAPYGGRFGGHEFGVLNQYFGRGANQELSMAKPNAPMGAMHALVYGAGELEGPWHGGRGYNEIIAVVRDTLDGLCMADDVVSFLNKFPQFKNLKTFKGGVAATLKLLKDGKGFTQAECEMVRDGLQDLFHKGLEKGLGHPVDMALVRDFCNVWGAMSETDIDNLFKEVMPILDAAEHRGEGNKWSVEETEKALLPHDASYVAAHPFLGARPAGAADAKAPLEDEKPVVPGDLSWLEGDLKRAANLVSPYRAADRYKYRFPFRGVQIWNEPHGYGAKLGSPSELTALNIWRAGMLKEEPRWQEEFAFGMAYYLRELVQPGLNWSFAPDVPRDDAATRLFMRKYFHLAGSDAHGSFNYTTGVGATMLTDPRFQPVFALFMGVGHGTETHTSHYGAARVYSQKPSVDEFLDGRVVCTDGPLAWVELDGDTCFDSLTSIWHDSWRTATKGVNADGEIGGSGKYSGGRTALVRRGCPDMVLRYRVAGSKGCGGDVKRLEVYRHTASEKHLKRSTRGMQVPWLVPAAEISPGTGEGLQFAALGGAFGPEEPQILMAAAFTSPEERGLFDIEQGRCIANPIWISTVEIGISARPVVIEGKAFVPKGAFVATFRTDHSVTEGETPSLRAKQLNTLGDSLGPAYVLTPVWSETAGYWQNEERSIDGKLVRVADCRMTAVNLEPIPLCPPWYPVDGVDTFAVTWDNARDAHGNPLNSVANTVEIAVPQFPPPAPGPDTAGGPHDGNTPTGNGGTTKTPDGSEPPDRVYTPRPADGAVVHVRTGEKIELPKGATLDGKTIPSGEWTVPELPAKGLSLLVSCGGQTLTLLLTSAAASPEPFLERGNPGFYGQAPAPGQGPATVSLKNHSAKTVESPTPVLVAGSTCVFSAPLAEPGSCDVTVTQGSASSTTSLDAVAAQVAWDSPDALPGETRALQLVLEGASKPSDWAVSGTVEITNGDILSVADPALMTVTGATITLKSVPGAAVTLAQVRARDSGKMVAAARLRILKVEGK